MQLINLFLSNKDIIVGLVSGVLLSLTSGLTYLIVKAIFFSILAKNKKYVLRVLKERSNLAGRYIYKYLLFNLDKTDKAEMQLFINECSSVIEEGFDKGIMNELMEENTGSSIKLQIKCLEKK